MTEPKGRERDCSVISRARLVAPSTSFADDVELFTPSTSASVPATPITRRNAATITSTNVKPDSQRRYPNRAMCG